MYQLDAKKLFASSWYIFLTYIYDARSHLHQRLIKLERIHKIQFMMFERSIITTLKYDLHVEIWLTLIQT